MRPWRSPSLRLALIARLVTAMLVIGVVGVGGVYALGQRYANLAYDRSLSDDVLTLVGQLEVHDGRVLVNLPPQARQWLLANEGERVLYRVIDLRDDRLLDGNGDLGERPRDGGPGSMQFRDVTIDGAPMRVAWVSGDLPQTEVPVLVEVAETLGRRKKVTSEILGGSVALFALLIGAAVLVVWQGTRRAFDPLGALAAEAGRRSAADLEPLDREAAPVEVRGFIDAINRMMVRVAKAVGSQSHFIANAAHQLRTPLAGLQLQAQLALDEPASPAVHQHLREIESGARRATHLVEQLMTLAKAEVGGARPLREPVDLAELASRAIAHHLPAAVRRGIDLGFDGPPQPVVVSGHPTLLDELLSNLVDNALRHARAARVVTVQLARLEPAGPGDATRDAAHAVSERSTRCGGAVALKVVDDGQGLPASVRARLFERFGAADPGGEGSGLGLAIVKEIAELHGASVRCHSTPAEGTEVVVEFPHSVVSSAP